jgi:hypothetical protein
MKLLASRCDSCRPAWHRKVFLSDVLDRQEEEANLFLFCFGVHPLPDLAFEKLLQFSAEETGKTSIEHSYLCSARHPVVQGAIIGD